LVFKQELITVAAILIVIGAIVWLVAWPSEALTATSIVGQVLFWIGIALLILWGIAIGVHFARTT